MAQDKPACEEQGSELFTSLEKVMKNKNHLMQTLNKSAMYEPVLLIDTRVKAVSPEYNSHRMKKCCCEWVFDRKHQACRDLMSHGIALVTKNYHVMMFPELS